MRKVSYIIVCIVLAFTGIYLVSARPDNRTNSSPWMQLQQGQTQPSGQNDQAGGSGNVSAKEQVASKAESTGSNNNLPGQDQHDQMQMSTKSDQHMESGVDNSLYNQSVNYVEPARSNNNQSLEEQHVPVQTSENSDKNVASGKENYQTGQAVSARQLATPESIQPLQQEKAQAAAVSDQPGSSGMDVSRNEPVTGEPKPAVPSNSLPVQVLQDQGQTVATGDQIIRPRAGISWKELVMRQREISRRAAASRNTLMAQAAEISQDGIHAEILNVMQ
jgi:hypothetical protein